MAEASPPHIGDLKLVGAGMPRRARRQGILAFSRGGLLRLLRIVSRVDIFEAPRAIGGDLEDSLLIEVDEMGRVGRQREETARRQRLGGAPTKIDTAKARAARKACLEVLEGQREAAAARKAFWEAAEEAGILIGDDNRPPPKPMKRKR
jgi:hypothetical protein